MTVHMASGEVMFRDPSYSIEHRDAIFDTRLRYISTIRPSEKESHLHLKHVFSYTDEEFKKILIPMIQDGKEPIGSMGDTARLAIFSDQPRSFFDYFYQNFAQVTNPPLDYIREKMVTDLRFYLGKKPTFLNRKNSFRHSRFRTKKPGFIAGTNELFAYTHWKEPGKNPDSAG